MEVAKITEQLALEIIGQLSNDGIRYFNPREDALGNWIMDLQMAINNNIEHTIIVFDTSYFEALERLGNSNNESIK